MMTFAVTYSYAPQPAELTRLRPERHTFFHALEDSGSLLASGQILDSDDADGMLVLRAESAQAAESTLDGDPYVRAGLVARRTVMQWNPTVGTWLSR